MMKGKVNGVKRIYLISDSTGELGWRFTNALLTQFPNDKIQFKKFNFVTGTKEIDHAFSKILNGSSGVLFHTVVQEESKRHIALLAQKKGISAFDLTGPPTDFLVANLCLSPVWDVDTIHPIDDDYEKRIEAIEFTIAHDDGAGNNTLKDADIILVGPSRCSKTPTSMYLSTKGFKVANIPIMEAVDQTQILQSIAKDRRVYALYVTPQALSDIRLKRVSGLGVNPKGYTDLSSVQKELLWARRLYQRYDWKTIDVTGRAIEETAALIMKELKET